MAMILFETKLPNDSMEYLVKNGDDVKWLSVTTINAMIQDENARNGLFREWQTKARNIVKNFHVHGTLVAPNTADCKMCHDQVAPGVAEQNAEAARTLHLKRNRGQEDIDLSTYTAKYTAHTKFLLSFIDSKKNLIPKVQQHLYVDLAMFRSHDPYKKLAIPSLLVSQAEDGNIKVQRDSKSRTRKFESFHDFADAYWRLARLRAIFYPNTQPDAYELFATVVSWTNAGIPIQNVAQYFDSLLLRRQGSSCNWAELDQTLAMSLQPTSWQRESRKTSRMQTGGTANLLPPREAPAFLACMVLAFALVTHSIESSYLRNVEKRTSARDNRFSGTAIKPLTIRFRPAPEAR